MKTILIFIVFALVGCFACTKDADASKLNIFSSDSLDLKDLGIDLYDVKKSSIVDNKQIYNLEVRDLINTNKNDFGLVGYLSILNINKPVAISVVNKKMKTEFG